MTETFWRSLRAITSSLCTSRAPPVVSNSLAGLLVATGPELQPGFEYSSRFLAAVRSVWLVDETRDGELVLRGLSYEIPTTTTAITGWFVENLVIRPDLSTAFSRKVREAPSQSFADYKARLTAATASLFANGAPYEPVVALSAGYDSAAVAAVASAAGAKRSVGFAYSRPARGRTIEDSGARTAAALGLEHSARERLSYRDRADLVEADFLATGMAGEDVVFAAFEGDIQRSIFLNCYWVAPNSPRLGKASNERAAAARG